MRMKTFNARSTTAAIRAIKEAMGPDAVIVGIRQLEEGVEVTAAVDRDEPPARSRSRSAVTDTVSDSVSVSVSDSGSDSLSATLSDTA